MQPSASATEEEGRRIGIIFIANRGEIARRVTRTAIALGMRTVVPVTDGPDALDLLDIAAVVDAAISSGAHAVHPGFGFLAENADFAAAVVGAGLVWVGPPPAAIRAMGDKAEARRLAVSLGVPVIPGYDEADQSDAALAGAATRVGYPVLVKPAAGGGGKGMRVVRRSEDLAAALAGARREALAAFADDRLVLERLVEGARHVEVQVLFDRHGNGVHLGERDCSIQRRHQKILEETPSPAVGPELRRRLGGHALALAGAVGYEGAGTCEFLLTENGEVFFLEMNTRLQVEHPVTELVTGRDLVADQLRIAAGAGLGIAQAAVDAALTTGGHAVEVRLYAEDPEAGFLPATGPVAMLRWPTGPGIRVDTGIDAGSEVTGRFDPMLAKVIAHGADRHEALGRLAEALDRTVVLGLTTNLGFLRWLVRQPAVADGEARTDTLGRIWPPPDAAEGAAIPDAAWQVAARALAQDPAGSTPVGAPWDGGWRLNTARRLRVASGDRDRTVTFEDAARGSPTGADEAPLLVRVGSTVHVDVGGRSVPFRLAPPPDVDRAARAAAAAHHGAGPVEVVAPMPGAVLAVHRALGTTVEPGEPIATLEAMKMEHLVLAPIGGRLAEVPARVGDQVIRGQVLAVVEP